MLAIIYPPPAPANSAFGLHRPCLLCAAIRSARLSSFHVELRNGLRELTAFAERERLAIFPCLRADPDKSLNISGSGQKIPAPIKIKLVLHPPPPPKKKSPPKRELFLGHGGCPAERTKNARRPKLAQLFLAPYFQKNSRRLELSISKNTPHGRLGQDPGSVNPRFPAGLLFPGAQIPRICSILRFGKNFQQFSRDFPGVFLENP